LYLYMELIELNHPLKEHYLTILRDKNTDFDTFRISASKLSYLLAVESTKHLSLKVKEVETPLIKTKGSEIENNSVAISVLRAGLGLVDGVKELIPNVSFGYIGVQRNEETAEPENYYEKLPDLNDKNVFILEPMLATGGSLSFAIETVKKYKPKNIHALTVISSPEGIDLIKKNHSDVTLITASIDEKLNENWYIVPGLGDMGDRLFGTT
ncbi:MAG: uracil phosphoribosyltransferase, partial [Actinomycetota bacterium]|nr:uracil phosphoribosyltransferase [Actinomycetota bacterium]